MTVQRTELRDDLTALIAAARELSPEHDQALAEVFIDQLASKTAAPSQTRRIRLGLRRPRRLVGTLILALACLGTASIVSDHYSSGAGSMQVPAMPAKAKVKMPAKAFRVPGTGKGPAVPLVPKVPQVLNPPKPKAAS